MESIYDHTHIGTVINEKYIEDAVLPVEILASEDGWIHSPHYPNHFTADGDNEDSFKDAIAHATDPHFHIFERDIRHHIDDKTEHLIRYRLTEEELYGVPDIDTTQCGHHIAFEPVIINNENKEIVEQCLRDAANDINWLVSESLQIFLQTTNPCCWDNQPPRKRYGKEWISDTESRLICMVRDIPDDIYMRCTLTGVTQSTITECGGYLLETNQNKETYHQLPALNYHNYYPLNNKEMWKGHEIWKDYTE